MSEQSEPKSPTPRTDALTMPWRQAGFAMGSAYAELEKHACALERELEAAEQREREAVARERERCIKLCIDRAATSKHEWKWAVGSDAVFWAGSVSTAEGLVNEIRDTESTAPQVPDASTMNRDAQGETPRSDGSSVNVLRQPAVVVELLDYDLYRRVNTAFLVDGEPKKFCDCDPNSARCPKGHMRVAQTVGWSRCLVPVKMVNLSDIEHPEQHAKPDSEGST